MKISWLEKLAQDGHIREEVLKDIYGSCQELLDHEKVAEMSPAAAMLLPLTVGAIMGAGAMFGGQAIQSNIRDAKVKAAIDVNRSKIVNNPAFSPKEKEKAEARFNEIVKFAPHLGANEAAMTRLVHSKMESGLSDRDVQNLISMQLHLSPDPFGHTKVASAEEICGSIIGDMYVEMEKKAGASAIARSIGLHTLRTVVPLAVAGLGIAGATYAKSILDEKKLNSQLNQSYRSIMDTSEGTLLAEHPQKAKEAFNTLMHFAPHVAIEPNAARAFMTKLVAYSAGPNASDIKDLADIENKMTSDPSSGVLGHIGAGMSAVGVPHAISRTWEHATSSAVDRLRAVT